LTHFLWNFNSFFADKRKRDQPLEQSEFGGQPLMRCIWKCAF